MWKNLFKRDHAGAVELGLIAILFAGVAVSCLVAVGAQQLRSW